MNVTCDARCKAKMSTSIMPTFWRRRLSSPNGMVLPFLSEFLENSMELEEIESDEEWKQDCELKAFLRLAKRLKKNYQDLN